MKKFFSEIIFAFARVIPGLTLLSLVRDATANPAGLTVQSGSATISVSGSQFTINAGNNAYLNWQHFNIGSGETTIFNQPSASSIVWNHVNDPNPSQIYGTIQANGVVVLLNSSGFYFGPGSFVSAAGLVVSTANYIPPQNAGGAWEFNGPPPLASIINYGTIKIGNSGSAFLIADKVENHGDIIAPGGSIGFAAGQTVTLSERADGRGMSMAVTLPQGSVDNHGNIIANAGTVALNAKVVNQDGVIQANSIQNRNGVIELIASDSITLGVGSKITADADSSSSGSAGGQISLQTDGNFSDAAGGLISAIGGANSGNGGSIEIDAQNIQSMSSTLAVTAGLTGGNGGNASVNASTIESLNLSVDAHAQAGGSDGSLSLNSAQMFGTASASVNAARVSLTASKDITFGNNASWNLSALTGDTSGQLALNAGGSILLNGNSSIQAANGNLNLTAGKDITVNSGFVITTGSGAIDAHALKGNINTGSFAEGFHFILSASSMAMAYDLSGGLGGISTMGGGDLKLTAGGDVTSILPGKKGYFFNGNFVSAQNNDYTTAGAGAYGGGNVDIIAGGNVTGHYLIANGMGNIIAGVKMDSTGNPIKDASDKYVFAATGSAGTAQLSPNFALSLISGGWNVSAAQNIFLQEVRNPNGVFNTVGAAAVKHLFNYSKDAFVNLSAGNAVQLGGTFSGLPRLDTLNVPMIYPGILRVNSGSGGVTLVGDSIFNQLILFPSPQGSLVINTTDGGPLTGKLPTSAGAPQIFNLIVSDSAATQYKNSTSFGMNDHANSPIHADTKDADGNIVKNSTPIQLNVSGDMNLLALIAPEAAQFNVVGNMNNCRFQGMNLSDGDTTSITVGAKAKANMELAGILNAATDAGLVVGGDINNRSAFTSVDLSSVIGAKTPNLSVLARSIGGSPSGVTLANSFYYNPTTKVLTYQNIPGVNFASLLQTLQSLTVQKVDSLGNPLWKDVDHTIPQTEPVSVINAATATALLNQYNALGAIPAGNLGYTIGGGGKFEITAKNMDLGTTLGIQSKGVGYYRNPNGRFPLASFLTHGADIDISLAGNLTMYSSSIASLNGGHVAITAGGSVSAGSSEFNVTATGGRGIFSTSRGDVSVFADGDVNVNGSRIAAYDGGNVTVESFNGNINAGSGGLGYVVLTAYYVNPKTHQVYTDNPTIPGSGILATTFPMRDKNYPAPVAPIGNILVETPNGKVNANQGGIVQLSFNGIYGADSTVAVLAGFELRDGHGDRVTAANIYDGTAVQVSDEHDIIATGSGVIAQNAVLKASGKIDGVIFARGNIDLSAVGNVNVTALAQGNVTVDSGGTVSGTLIGVGGVSASGSSVDASLLSQNISTSGDTSGAKEGFAQGTAANAASTGASNEDTKVAKTSDSSSDEDDLKKKRPVTISLAQKISRVTVILPASKL